jgi:hypothetical protein
MAEMKPEVWCRDVSEYFSAITDAVRVHGLGQSSPMNDTRTLTVGVVFPDRTLRIRLNQIKVLGETKEWHESVLKLPSGTIVKRISRFDERKCLAEFKRRTLEAVEEGERLRALGTTYH